MSLKIAVASAQWVLRERNNANELLQQESEELGFPAIAHIEWLNEHMKEILKSTKFDDLKHFKTPGRLRVGKTPKTAFKSATKLLKSAVKRGVDLVDPRLGDDPWIVPFEKPIELIEEAENEDVEMAAELEEPAKEEELLQEPQQQPERVQNPPVNIVEESPERSPVRLYTDSDIGSPSVSDTPEKPLRKGSFSFAALPGPEPLKRSMGAQAPEHRYTRAESLGLDSEASEDESVDLRAPELIAHEERMKAYESPVQPPPSSPVSTPTAQPEVVAEEQPNEMPGMYPTIENLEEEESQDTTPPAPRRTRSSGKQKIEDHEAESAVPAMANTKVHEALEDAKSQLKEPVQNVSQPSIAKAASARSNAPDRSRLRAPKPLGRPVRPTATATKAKQQPQPVAIKIKPLSHPKPMNTAPVAPHNLDSVRAEPQQPELKKKASAQSIVNNTTQFSKSTNKPPPPPPKVFDIAKKKRERDEEAAAKDAAVKQQQTERRNNKIEEIRRKKEREEAEKDRKARENSAERQKKHFIDIEDRDVKRQKSEERQEREQAAADAKKAAFREMQAKRQIRPATSAATGRPPNPPPRPPARLDLHEDMRAEEDNTPPRLAGPIRQPSLQRQQPDADLPAYPSNLSKPPVRVSNLTKKTSIFTSTQAGPPNLPNFPPPPRNPAAGPSMQHFATQKIPFAKTPIQTQAQYLPNNLPNRAPQGQIIGNNAAFMPMQPQIPNIQPVDESPMSLPEIHTDSSDESNRDISLPSWATPNHIFNMLSQQETVNPDHIFPAMTSIVMDDVFAENPDRLRRLRMRTSSANWVRTGDALNQVEVLEDRIGRQAISNAGGWYYGVGH